MLGCELFKSSVFLGYFINRKEVRSTASHNWLNILYLMLSFELFRACPRSIESISNSSI